MRQLKKIEIKDLKGEKLTKPELMFLIGGYDLPEVVVTCGQTTGQCWECVLVNSGEFSGYCRQPTGKMSDYCSAIRKCDTL